MIVEILVLVVVVIVIALGAFIASRPSTFVITRSAVIPAPAEAIFAEVNDLHRWEAWSPWARLDPSAQNTYYGMASGPGSIFRWEGNSKVGAGSMTILESRPGQLVRIQLEFIKPFKATNLVEFTFEPVADATRVTWTMSGTSNFANKAVGLVMNCEKMIGGMYEQGLANLKTVVAVTPRATPAR